MFLFQLLLDKSTEYVYLNLGFMRVTLNGILNGLEQTKFILTLITLFLLFFETTDIEDLMISLQEKCKPRYKLRYHGNNDNDS